MLPFVALTLAALAALLVAEYTGSRAGKWIAKPLASTGFIAAAVAAGALDHRYGLLVLAGLVLSWFGDVFLIPDDRPSVFLAGVASFLLGHVAYTVAFVSLGLATLWAGVAIAAFAAIGLPVFRWLRPHIPADMKGAAYAYMVVISAMVVCAAGAAAATGRATIFIGAFAFYLSDLSVASDRFVEPAFANRAWGLPLYYIAQLILASTVAMA